MDQRISKKRNRLHRANAQFRGGMINQDKASVVVTLHELRREDGNTNDLETEKELAFSFTKLC